MVKNYNQCHFKNVKICEHSIFSIFEEKYVYWDIENCHDNLLIFKFCTSNFDLKDNFGYNLKKLECLQISKFLRFKMHHLNDTKLVVWKNHTYGILNSYMLSKHIFYYILCILVYVKKSTFSFFNFLVEWFKKWLFFRFLVYFWGKSWYYLSHQFIVKCRYINFLYKLFSRFHFFLIL